jgi:prophage maintenance system killer protein
MLSKKDIIAINEEFHGGRVVNEGSLDFAITMTKRSRNWLKTAALLTRAILIDHVFEDGNKRTAAAVILALADINGVYCNPDRVNAAIVRMLKRNTTDVRTIERLIKDAIE